MKIALVSQQFGKIWSGVGKYAQSLAKALTDKHHEVTLICPKDGIANVKVEGFRVITCPTWEWDRSHGKWLSVSFEAARILRRIRKNAPLDIIHFTDARESLFLSPAAATTLGTMHDYYFAVTPRNPFGLRRDYADWKARYVYYQLVKILEKRAIKKLKGIICNSRFVQKVLLEKYQVKPEATTVIYIGYDPPPRRECVPERKEMPSTPRLLFVGGNLQRKGIRGLIRAVRLLVIEGHAVIVDVVGDNRMRRKIMTLVDQAGLGRYFRFWGWVDPEGIIKFYRNADIFVMPSVMEAYGLVYLEAMSYGVPVIAAGTGGVGELIKDGKNGILVDPHNTVELKERILGLMKDRFLRGRIVEGGWETVRGRSMEMTALETLEFYRCMKGANADA